MLLRRFHSSMAVSLSVSLSAALPWRSTRPRRVFVTTTTTTIIPLTSISLSSPLCPRRSIALSFCSNSDESTDLIPQPSSKQCPLKPGLYLVGTPIGNLEDITLRALRVLRSADVILSEDTRHSGKLLQHYNIKTPLLSYHKFNESQREQGVLNRLRQGEIVAQISDAGTPGISDPGMELVKLCVKENLPVIPIPGPSAFVAALSASGLATEEFTFVGFLPKHAGSRRERMIVSANEVATQIFFVPPHKLHQFVEEASSIFGDCRHCVIAREMTKVHEEFWRGTLEEAKQAFSTRKPKGEITFLIEGKANYAVEIPSESQLENDLRELISGGHSLSMAVKLVAGGTSVRRREIYSLALRKFGKQVDKEN
ncbi:Ribosomal RNA small subunit methyltransferase [Actinidia chinensis var. chinensis]|uniref:Ribosomal RNA small subunit methyltransferase n=1 Tax=Actinidia chinensis var. chinensis TaxID=1590841 RepID=A0A2R6PZQ5_ACTCC|nr:Ribosomal RNA small subunit methyltransferase [Actinidia chinensis var. chinensis]